MLRCAHDASEAGPYSSAWESGRATNYERLALRGDAPGEFHDGCEYHKARAQEIAGEDAHARAGLNQAAEQVGRARAADGRAERIEDGDGKRADFDREDLADGEVGAARCGRGEKKIAAQAMVCCVAVREPVANSQPDSASSTPEIE